MNERERARNRKGVKILSASSILEMSLRHFDDTNQLSVCVCVHEHEQFDNNNNLGHDYDYHYHCDDDQQQQQQQQKVYHV